MQKNRTNFKNEFKKRLYDFTLNQQMKVSYG